MRMKPLPSILALIVLSGWVPVAAALAKALPQEVDAGFTSFQMEPHNGGVQRLNGVALGARYLCHSPWSLEATASLEKGTEDGSVDLRQSMLVAGPRYTLRPAGRWTPYLHFLVGISQLKASRGDESDRASSLVYGPGAGVDFALNRHWALRVQEGFECTRYAGAFQGNSRFLLGVVFRK